MQSITDIVLLDFSLMHGIIIVPLLMLLPDRKKNATLLNVYFILQYHFFFHKEVYFFECLYFSEYDIQMSLYDFLVEKGDIN